MKISPTEFDMGFQIQIKREFPRTRLIGRRHEPPGDNQAGGAFATDGRQSSDSAGDPVVGIVRAGHENPQFILRGSSNLPRRECPRIHGIVKNFTGRVAFPQESFRGFPAEPALEKHIIRLTIQLRHFPIPIPADGVGAGTMNPILIPDDFNPRARADGKSASK